MKSVDEIQKMKVPELRQECTLRGLDSKGVKAVLVDRLLDAMELEAGGEVGNGSAMRPAISDPTAVEEEEIEDPEHPGQESPKRATRGLSPNKPVLASPFKASVPTPIVSEVQGKLVASTPSTVECSQNSAVQPEGASSTPQNNSFNVTPEKALDPAPGSPSKPTSPVKSASLLSSPSKQQASPTKVSPAKTVPVSSESNKEASSTNSLQAPAATTTVEAAVSVNSTKDDKAEAGIEAQSQPSQNVESEGPQMKSLETGNEREDSMETEDSETLKRKHDEEGAEAKEDETVKNGEQSKKIRLDHYTVRIPPENEPEFDDTQVTLDWYKSDLNLVISKEGYLKGTPTVYDDFPWAYAGVKATYGFTAEKLAFEVTWLEDLNVRIDFGEVEAKHVLRVGWSDLYADLQLGESKFSYGYDSQGKLYNAGETEELEEATFEKGDVIASFLDFEGDHVEIKFTKNGTGIGKSIQIPKADMDGKLLFPHILARNVSFEANFGSAEPAHPLLDDYKMVDNIETTNTNKIRGPKAPSAKSDCEFVMLCGMACCGKTTWAKKHKENNPDKHFNIIGTSSVVERAVKKTTIGGDKTPRVYDSFLMKAGRFVEKLVDLAPTRRRNYILDQSNVLPLVQRRKAAGFEGFKRRAVVILPNDEEYQNRIKAREQEQGKSVPKSTVLDMKATIRLPEVGEIFEEVDFPELSREVCEELLKKYNKEGADAGYFGQKSPRGGGQWHGSGRGGFRGGRGDGFRGGFRGPRRGGPGGFRGGPPFRFMRGDFRPPRGNSAGRVPRDMGYSPRSFGPPRGRAGAPQPLISPRRGNDFSSAPRPRNRNPWSRGSPPINSRGSPQRFNTPTRGGYGGRGEAYGGSPMGAPRAQQSIWTSGQPGGGWGRSAGGYSQQQPDPWVQQVPDQGYGQSWDANRGGGGGGGSTWQGYGGQTYGYGRK